MSISADIKERENLYRFAGEGIKASRARRVLDMASAEARGAAIIARINPGAEVTAVDLNKELLDAGRREFALPNLRFVVGDARKTDFSDGFFHAIVSFHTIEHLSSADQVIFVKELRRIVSPHGVLFIATPDVDVWAMQGMAGLQEDHVRELTQEEFILIVSGGGFVIDGVYGQGIAKQGKRRLRRALNLLKKADVFRMRKLFKKTVDAIDTKTQPVSLDYTVKPMIRGREKASITVLRCHPANH